MLAIYSVRFYYSMDFNYYIVLVSAIWFNVYKQKNELFFFVWFHHIEFNIKRSNPQYTIAFSSLSPVYRSICIMPQTYGHAHPHKSNSITNFVWISYTNRKCVLYSMNMVQQCDVCIHQNIHVKYYYIKYRPHMKFIYEF